MGVLAMFAAATIASATGCDSTSAREAALRSAEAAGMSRAGLDGEPKGPFGSWGEFERSAPVPAIETKMSKVRLWYLKWLVRGHRFYFVFLTPKPTAHWSIPYMGGKFWAFVDAGTCEVVESAPDVT